MSFVWGGGLLLVVMDLEVGMLEIVGEGRRGFEDGDGWIRDGRDGRLQGVRGFMRDFCQANEMSVLDQVMQGEGGGHVALD